MAHFGGVPPYAGSIDYERTGNGISTFAVLQGLVAHEGDGWTLTVEELERYYENSAGLPLPEELTGIDSDAAIVDLITLSEWQPSKLAEDHLGIALDAAARIGKSIGELHLALGAPTDDPAFTPEPLTAADLQKRLATFRQDSAAVFDVLRGNVAQLPDELLDLAGMVLAQRKQILGSFQLADDDNPHGQRIRIHGDLHLGQVLRVRTDYMIVNFSEREKHSPLKDVACMLRSFARAAYSSLIGYTARRPEEFEKLEPWALLWERSASAEFLRAYRDTVKDAPFMPAGQSGFRALLRAYWLDKVMRELSQELHDRPAWARIPLMGILSLPIEAGGLEWSSTPFRSRL
jgi:maltose alpha-D-glucosyltransferase/alpha-amylase